MEKKCCVGLLRCAVVSFLIFLSCSAFPFDIRKPSEKEIFIGYGGDEKLQTGNYSYLLAAFDFSYPLKETGWAKNFSFQIEPFLSLVNSPETSWEAGCAVFLKYSLPWRFSLKPYIRGGTGAIYTAHETEEQATKLNFADHLCYGVSYEKGGIKISAEFRNRHISNLDIREPNSGIDTKMWMLGVSSPF